MGEFLAGVALTAFAVFLYKKVTEDKPKSSGGSGGGGSTPDGPKPQIK